MPEAQQTVTIVSEDNPEQPAVINEADYDPEQHTLWEERDQPGTKKKSAHERAREAAAAEREAAEKELAVKKAEAERDAAVRKAEAAKVLAIKEAELEATEEKAKAEEKAAAEKGRAEKQAQEAKDRAAARGRKSDAEPADEKEPSTMTDKGAGPTPAEGPGSTGGGGGKPPQPPSVPREGASGTHASPPIPGKKD